MDHLDLLGENAKHLLEGDFLFGSKLPVNPSGGLMGTGHPVGATGVRMVVDCAKQVSGKAGEYQVNGAQKALAINIGGSMTTTVSFLVESGGD